MTSDQDDADLVRICFIIPRMQPDMLPHLRRMHQAPEADHARLVLPILDAGMKHWKREYDDEAHRMRLAGVLARELRLRGLAHVTEMINLRAMHA